jgi:tetratricopeptide (TPR) repeat protein
VLPLYYYYCFFGRDQPIVQALNVAIDGINQVDSEHDEPYLRPCAQACNGALTSYHASVADDEAISFYRNAIANELQIRADDQDKSRLCTWYIFLGDGMRERGKYKEALELYEDAIKVDTALYEKRPTDRIAYCKVAKADVYALQKEWRRAAELYSQVAHAPHSEHVSNEHAAIAAVAEARAYAALLGVPEFMHRFEVECAPYLKAGAQLENKDQRYHVWFDLKHLGDTYSLLGDDQKAMVHYDNAFRFADAPDNRARIWESRADIYSRAANEDKCLAACKAAVEEWKIRDTDPIAHILHLELQRQYARAQLQFGHPEKAKALLLSIYADSQQLNPEAIFRLYILRDLASVCAATGDTSHAIEYLNRAVDFDSKFASACEGLDRGNIALLQKNYAQADYEFREALFGAEHSHSWFYPMALTGLAKVRLATGNTSEARRLLKNALNSWQLHNEVRPLDGFDPDYLYVLHHL